MDNRLVHWESTKQQLTALSSCEAELDAAVTGVKQTGGIVDAIADLDATWAVRTEMYVDNAAALRSMKFVATSWRNRHFAIRASWIRDMIEQKEIIVMHKPGKDLEADALTKILDRVKLQEMRKKLGLEALFPETE